MVDVDDVSVTNTEVGISIGITYELHHHGRNIRYYPVKVLSSTRSIASSPVFDRTVRTVRSRFAAMSN